MNEILFYGADWCSDCQRAKIFLKTNNIEYQFIDVDIDEKASQKVEKLNKGKRIIPTIIINQKVYTNPDNGCLASILGINKVGKVTLYGANWCPDCRRAKTYLQNNDINYQFIDVDKFDWATEKVIQINQGKRIIPTIIIGKDSYTNPDNATLKKVLKIDSSSPKEVFDSIIIGAGPAGLTASIYIQRDRYNSLILEKKNIGGNASLTKKIENYPGFTNISGAELMKRMAEQAQTYGTKIETGVEVLDIIKKNNQFVVKTNMGDYFGKTVIVSVGSTYRKLNIPLEKELIGAGIHFCATCDGAFYRNKEILVIGVGNSALEEGIFLSNFCKKVSIINRNNEFSGSQTYLDKIETIKNIQLYKNKESIAFIKNEDNTFKGLQIRDKKTGKEDALYADGTFIYIGLVPNTKAFKNILDLNEQGFIKTNGFGQTNIKGIFAAGDCREGAIAQVAASTGEGVLASYGIREYFK